MREEKVSSPLANWGFGGLNEGVRAGLLTYIHLRVGRDEADEMLRGTPFVAVRDGEGQVSRACASGAGRACASATRSAPSTGCTTST